MKADRQTEDTKTKRTVERGRKRVKGGGEGKRLLI